MSQIQNLQTPEDVKKKFGEIQKAIEKNLEGDPNWIPDANTVLTT
jgi:hypothetical protein